MVEATDSVVVADGSRSGMTLRGISGALGSTLLRYRARADYDSDFLHYFLESLHGWLNTATIGGAVPHLDKRLLGQLRVAIPSDKREQELIGQVLHHVDDTLMAGRVELNAAQRTRTALLQTLFAQGIPGRHSEFRDTKIGRIPAEWEILPLGKVAEIDSGVTLNQDRAPRDNAYQYLTVVNVQRGLITVDEPRFIELNNSEVPRKLLVEGDILVVEGHANSTEIGRAAMVSPEYVGLSFQNHLFRVRTSDPSILSVFLLHAMNSRYAQKHWNATCNTSSGLNTLNRRQLRKFLLFIPQKDEQEKMLELIKSAETAISAVEAKITALERLKQSLLQNLLTGRLRVQP